MINTKLILLDGMTGVGKSTTAQRLWLHLERQGQAAQWFYEHDVAHPIWQTAEWIQLVEAGSIDSEFVDDVLLKRWFSLAHECCRTGNITILEGTFLQSTVGFLLALDIPERAIVEHMLAVDAAIAGTAPALIYFRQRDVAKSLSAVFHDRRAYDYAAALTQYIARTPYGKRVGLSDIAGLARFYEHWAAIVDSLLPQLVLLKLVIERDAGDWPDRERQLTDFLGLPAISDFRDRIEHPLRFIGRYRDAASDDELVVVGDEQGLYLDRAGRTALIMAREGVFHIAGVGAELSFADEDRGSFQRIHLRGNLAELSPVWIRTNVGDDAGEARSPQSATRDER